MEARAKKIVFVLGWLLLACTKAIAQKWEQVADFEMTRRMGAISFSWGGKGYVGFGHDYNAAYPFNDLNAYDPISGQWQEVTYLDSGFRTCAFSFVVGDEVFIGGGTKDSGQTALRDFYKYDLHSGLWTKLHSLPFSHAIGARAVLCGGTPYLLGGCTTLGCEDRIWAYHVADDAWTPGKALPLKSIFGIAFSLNNELYYGLGNGVKQLAYAEIWKTNPTDTNAWVSVHSFTRAGRTLSVGVAIDSIHAIAGMGFKISDYLYQLAPFNAYLGREISPERNFMMNDLWLYNALTDKWKRLQAQKKGRRGAIAFVAGNFIYIGMGNAENKLTKDVYRLDLSRIKMK